MNFITSLCPRLGLGGNSRNKHIRNSNSMIASAALGVNSSPVGVFSLEKHQNSSRNSHHGAFRSHHILEE
jgi:Co/Zn/Cd efflux system component